MADRQHDGWRPLASTQQSIDLRFKEIVPSEVLRRRLCGHSAVCRISRLPITPELEHVPAQSAGLRADGSAAVRLGERRLLHVDRRCACRR